MALPSSQWANHIVGRWWEVFWEPTATSSSSSVEEKVVIGATVDGENEIQQGAPRSHISPPYLLDGSILSLDHSPSFYTTQPQDSPPPQLQQINVLFTTPALGVALVLINNSTQIIIKEINDTNGVSSSSSSSLAALACLRPNDILVGINGTRLDDLLGRKVEGQEAFQEILQLLKSQSRPMVVMFERWVHNPAAAATSTALMSNNCGISDLKQNDRNSTTTTNDDDDDDDEDDLNNENNSTSEPDDDIDWYDAKILSYNDTTGKHTIYFLGSETSVTYEMVLSMKIVRPSVRAWTKRTLALLNLNAEKKIITSNSIEHYISPSTEFLNDINHLDSLQHSERTKFTNVITSTNKVMGQVLEYKLLLAKQLYLATNLSPPNVEEEEEEDDEDEDSGPGPSADSNYIKHLCSCIKESEKTCTWLLGESIMLDVMFETEEVGTTLTTMSTTATTTVTTRENILSFLVNGARFLNCILSFDPNCKVGAEIARRSSKKRRITSSSTRGGLVGSRAMDDKVFESLLSKALLFNESLCTTLNQLFEKSSSSVGVNRVWVATTLSNVLSTLFRDFWEPLISWIRKSDAMINGTSSGQLFSLADIERHVQQSKTKEMNLASIDLSVWITKLSNTLKQALSFEMEVWSVIRTCTQPVVAAGLTPGEDNDDCLLHLYRFKQYVTNDPIMRNINPLGKCGILTRGTIDDATTVRRWILDFNHAKVVRERIGFVKGIIERYSNLPQLPTPPPWLDGIVTNPSAILTASMKDSITMLSSHCYSYNHIIGSAAEKLQLSISGNEITTKDGLSVALAELTRLPVLSIAEEKLHLHEELIDWNREAQQLMDMSSKCKVSFGQVIDLNQQLSLILAVTSDKRKKVCQLLKNDRPVEDEIKNFAVVDEKVTCAITGAWVRDQYTRASEWKSNYCSIISILKSHGYDNVNDIEENRKSQCESVAIDRVTALLMDHETLAVSFRDELDNLESMARKVTDWTNTIQQILLSDSLTLDKRREQLTNASHLRPRGFVVDPSVDLIDQWIGVFAWRVQLKSDVRSMLDQFESFQDCSDFKALKKLVASTIGPLMIEDLIFPEEFASNSFATQLRREIFHSVQENTTLLQTSTKRKVIESGMYGKHLLDLIFSADADKNLGSCISLTRRVVWIMMLQRFIIHLESSDFVGGISDAKQLLSLSHEFQVTNSFLGTNAEENRLLLLIDNAESFEGQSSELIAQCSALLKTNCLSNKDELLQVQQHFCNVLSSLNEPETALAMKLLHDKTLGERISSITEGLTWLQKTFAYKILYQCADSQHSELCDRIHIDKLNDLCSTIPTGSHWRVSGECYENEIVRMSAIVENLKDQAEAWRSKVYILPNLSDISRTGSDIVKLDTLIELTADEILRTVNFPELELIQSAADVTSKIQTRLENDLFSYEYMGATDVSKARLPNRTSLVQSRGDFILHRFIGSEMYEEIRRTLLPIHEMAAQLPVRTVEKATLEWMNSIINWIESIHPEEDFRHQLVLKIEHALEVLEQGHMIFYSLPDEVHAYLERAKVGIHVLPQSFNVFDIRGVCTLGSGLLRWAAILYECLKSDVHKIVRWRLSASYAIESYLKVYSEGVGGISFSDATMFRDIVDRLIHESSNLIVTDNEMIYSLSSLSKRMKLNSSFQNSIDDERSVMELKQVLADKVQFTNPQNVVNNGYDLLDSIMGRLAILPYEFDDTNNKGVLFAGESSVRDKSRFFLETSLWTGMETLGFDLKETDAQDFSSIIAWRLEEIVHEVYNTDNSLYSVSSEYRNKIRDLRFNLMNPKNPMLCAQVLADKMTLHDLVSASTEELASNELKLMRRKVEEESIKNVVLAVDQEKKEHYISNELAAKIRIESTTMSRNSPEAGISAALRDKDMDALLSKYQSASSPEPDLSLRLATKETTHIRLPAPPMRVKKKHVHVVESRLDQFNPPPPMQINSLTSKSLIRHILSQSQTDLFQICISKLKISFTTKIATDPNCQLDVDHLLPSILVEKGRLSVDEFNKFINAKIKGGKWNLVCMKLSSIDGESNSKLYKRYYKEYESLGRLAMFQVSDSTKIFLITPKFHRMVKCLDNVDHLSKSSTYAVVLTKASKPQKPIDEEMQIDDDMF